MFANKNGVRAHRFSVHETDPKEDSFVPPLTSTQKVNPLSATLETNSETENVFQRSKSMKRKSIKNSEKRLVCPHCPKRCETKKGLKLHFSSVHNLPYSED